MKFTITEAMMRERDGCNAEFCAAAESMRAGGVKYPLVSYSHVSGSIDCFWVEGKTPAKLVAFLELFDSEACRRALMEKEQIQAVEWKIADEELSGFTRCQGPCAWDYRITLVAWRKLNGKGLVCPDCLHPQAAREEVAA